MRPTHFDRPRHARGFLPLLLAALGAAKGVAGIIQANQTKQKNKGYINANYRLASDNLNTNQGLARQNVAESLNERGLSPVAGAMMRGAQPTTLGGQVQSDAEHQFGLERTDLENQHNEALANNRDAYTNAIVQGAAGSIGGAISGYSTGMDAQSLAKGAGAAAGAAPAASRSPVLSQMLSGSSSDAQLGHAGVDVVDPLGHPDSAWFQGNKKTVNADGLSNSQFNSGSV